MTEEVLIEPQVWTTAFCTEVRRAMDLGEASPAAIVGGTADVDTNARRALDITLSEHWTQIVDAAIARLWPRVEAFFGMTVVGSVGATCLRYSQGGLYRRHRDRDPTFGPDTNDRRVSIIVCLTTVTNATRTGDFEGGILRIYRPDHTILDVEPVSGTLIAFPSDWSHEVLAVSRGTRDVVADWLV